MAACGGGESTDSCLLIQWDSVLGFMCCITWLGTLWNSAIPDLMGELGSVVVHIDHIDHNVNRVFYLVAIKVHCMSSQLKEEKRHIFTTELSNKDQDQGHSLAHTCGI